MKTVVFWQRIDEFRSLERLEIVATSDRIEVASTLITTEAGGFRLNHRWRLTPDWLALWVNVEQLSASGSRRLLLERDGAGWTLDGKARPDLEGAEEPDLSVTPFCNTLPIRRLPAAPGSRLPLETAYIDGAAMSVVRSSQRYERNGPRNVRYVDLGVAKEFEADIAVDDDALVVSYQHLFERVNPV